MSAARKTTSSPNFTSTSPTLQRELPATGPEWSRHREPAAREKAHHWSTGDQRVPHPAAAQDHAGLLAAPPAALAVVRARGPSCLSPSTFWRLWWTFFARALTTVSLSCMAQARSRRSRLLTAAPVTRSQGMARPLESTTRGHHNTRQPWVVLVVLVVLVVVVVVVLTCAR